jgi:hypothetical protein
MPALATAMCGGPVVANAASRSAQLDMSHLMYVTLGVVSSGLSTSRL